MRLLLVEDDPLLGDGLQAGLRQCGYSVEWLRDAASAEAALTSEHFDLMVLDLGLPDRSGISVLKGLRRRGDELPVLILTARDTVEERVLGLDSGADDYMLKPFDLDELAARLRALQRRHGGRADNLIQHGQLRLDPVAHTISQNEESVELPPREYAVLQLLLENRGRVLSRSRLEQSIYAWGDEVGSNAIEVYIHHLRKRFGSELIRTVRGVGYVIDPPEKP